MNRSLKKKYAKFLPEFIKSPFRARLFGYRPSQVKLNFIISQDKFGLFALINDRIKLRITEEEQRDYLYHFVENGASIEEIYGFIKAAESKHLLFDVGAHKGLFSLVFCACNDKNRSIAYEPAQGLFARAKELSQMNQYESRISLQDCAIGETNTIMNAYQDPGGFVLLTEDDSRHKVEVKVTTIDDECIRLGISPDILKIDVEGYEYEALLGASNLLATKKPSICLELHLDMLDRRGIKPKMVCDYLTKYGYKFFTCLGQELAPQDVYGSMNAILRLVAK